MRIAILSDIHSNLAALKAVLDDAEQHRSVDRLWVLGDTVGYGPHPNECIALLRRYPQDAIIGNHDLAALGRIDISWFNPSARAAAIWTGDMLDDESRQYLDMQPEVATTDGWTLVHGTLRQPVFEYLYSKEAAFGHLSLQETPFGLVGHTHVPAIAELPNSNEREASFRRVPEGTIIDVGEHSGGPVRIVLNPGGVGQPRDGDPRAAYALFDTSAGSVSFHRVPYDIAATQQAMEKVELPRPLIERLSIGR